MVERWKKLEPSNNVFVKKSTESLMTPLRWHIYLFLDILANEGLWVNDDSLERQMKVTESLNGSLGVGIFIYV